MSTKREEIWAGMRQILYVAEKDDYPIFACTCEECQPSQNKILDEILSYLHSQGCVRRVDRESIFEALQKSHLLPYRMTTDEIEDLANELEDYVAVEPLIEQ